MRRASQCELDITGDENSVPGGEGRLPESMQKALNWVGGERAAGCKAGLEPDRK